MNNSEIIGHKDFCIFHLTYYILFLNAASIKLNFNFIGPSSFTVCGRVSVDVAIHFRQKSNACDMSMKRNYFL